MPEDAVASGLDRQAPSKDTVAEPKVLTESQKKNRRKRLARLGAQQKASTSSVGSLLTSTTQSCMSDSTFEPAASEASTSAFANKSSRVTVAGLAADLMSGVTADGVTFAETAASTAESDAGTALITSTSAAPSLSPLTAQISTSACSEAAASCAAEPCDTAQRQQHANSEPNPVLSMQLPLDSPARSQQLGLICRRDMSAAALAVHASFVPLAVQTSIASPLNTDAQEAEPRAKRQKRVFIHGNYNRYYGYRLGSELEEDPRLQVLDRRWFHGKRCMDIGCNEGVITLAAVQRFAPLSMLGVDIDDSLIKTACRALSKQRTEASNLHQRLTRHTSSAELGDRPAAQRKAAAAAVRAFANVWFSCEDFASSEHTPQSLDTIMCLSITKWVHLNQGDEGLKRLFAKVKEALVPGGWFVLEPQPWRSYQQARRKQGLELPASQRLQHLFVSFHHKKFVRDAQEVLLLQDMSAAPFAHLDMLQLRPEAFPEYLEQELGFIFARELHVATSSAGFNRPMYLFQRGM